MCRSKCLNPVFRLHEGCEVLNKYIMGVWQSCRQDFAAGGPNTTRGVTFLKNNIGCMQQPGAKHEMRGRTPQSHHWRRPWRVDRFNPAFFVSFIVTVFVLDCAVAAQTCPPEMPTGAPQWWCLKNISTYRHIPRPNGFHITTAYPNFLFFFYFTICLVPFADTISTESVLESLQYHLESVWLKKVMCPKIKFSLVK